LAYSQRFGAMKINPYISSKKDSNRFGIVLIRILILVVVGGGTTLLSLFVLAWLIFFGVGVFLI